MPKKDAFEMPYMKKKMEEEEREKEVEEGLKTLSEITRKKERGRQEKEFEQALEERVTEGEEMERKRAKKTPEEKTRRAKESIAATERVKKLREEILFGKEKTEEVEEKNILSVETAGEIEIPGAILDTKKFEAMGREKSVEVAEELRENSHKTLEQEIDALQKNKIIAFDADAYFAVQAKISAYEEALAVLGDRLAKTGYDVNKGRVKRWFQKFNFTRKAEPDQLDKFNEEMRIYKEMKHSYENLSKSYSKMSNDIYEVIGHGNVFAIAARGINGGALGGVGIGLKK